jgi:hypothetical protein
MKRSTVALFGEAERGHFHTMYFCQNIDELFHYFGEPPRDTQGLYFAVQILLLGKPLLYFRVDEEGMSTEDYFLGFELLKDYPKALPNLEALFLPKAGSKLLVEEGLRICAQHHSLLLMSEADFYDYMTEAA